MGDYEKRVEAILFTTGRFMAAEEIAQLCQIGSIGVVKEALEKLRKEYETKDSALTVYEENNKFKLSIKKEYNYLTSQLLNNTELDGPTQETLAIIAYKQPILQAEVIKIRGNKAYDHIKILKDQEFVTSEKSGRTRLLKLTQKFFDYFDVVQDQLKNKFSEVEVKVGATTEEQKNLNQTKEINVNNEE
ncbi:SMC-Scp complex subunit ScpB [Candidatus Woesearchaeota archaeon]|nr:SMC-Scp complex subunit ScpB [Candidatus Woesearchaeota archaeon]